MEGIKRRRLGSEAWEELLRRHAHSGEPVGAFCRREGVSTHSYRRWKARLDEQVPTAATKPTSTGKPTKATHAAIAPFVDLGSLGTPAAAAGRLELRLDLGGGVTLHLVG